MSDQRLRDHRLRDHRLRDHRLRLGAQMMMLDQSLRTTHHMTERKHMRTPRRAPTTGHTCTWPMPQWMLVRAILPRSP